VKKKSEKRGRKKKPGVRRCAKKELKRLVSSIGGRAGATPAKKNRRTSQGLRIAKKIEGPPEAGHKVVEMESRKHVSFGGRKKEACKESPTRGRGARNAGGRSRKARRRGKKPRWEC